MQSCQTSTVRQIQLDPRLLKEQTHQILARLFSEVLPSHGHHQTGPLQVASPPIDIDLTSCQGCPHICQAASLAQLPECVHLVQQVRSH